MLFATLCAVGGFAEEGSPKPAEPLEIPEPFDLETCTDKVLANARARAKLCAEFPAGTECRARCIAHKDRLFNDETSQCVERGVAEKKVVVTPPDRNLD